MPAELRARLPDHGRDDDLPGLPRRTPRAPSGACAGTTRRSASKWRSRSPRCPTKDANLAAAGRQPGLRRHPLGPP
ncbi:hypothetical protein HBB16_11400 [Pseudonocardia sp. MCCB 268]|nr:hypothetical protein [Pseudonocardia cytotoxica]